MMFLLKPLVGPVLKLAVVAVGLQLVGVDVVGFLSQTTGNLSTLLLDELTTSISDWLGTWW